MTEHAPTEAQEDAIAIGTTTREAVERANRVAAEIEAWNDRHPAGTPVRYWPGGRIGPGRESVTRSQAWNVCGTPVVAVEGYAGGIALTHVEVPIAHDGRYCPNSRDGAGHSQEWWDNEGACLWCGRPA